MINVKDFYNTIKSNGTDFFCGVPDSLLKDFCAYVTDNTEKEKHIIAANEGNAIALAAGHYLASGNPALVYMQNSGLGNCINPLLSLTDEEVYKIPLLMLIGLRGESGVKDEPQHIKQGRVTDKILEAVSIEYSVLPQDFENAQAVVNSAFDYIKREKKPYALIVRKGTFEKYKLKKVNLNNFEISREEAVKQAAELISDNDIIVTTTGQISRELYEYRESKQQLHNKDFLTVGSMGHASSIALAVALQKPQRNVYCFDGDGAVIMHMGALPVISSLKPENFKHIVFNNQAHDSVGSQPTSAGSINFKELAKACGYKKAISVKTRRELIGAINLLKKEKGPVLLEIKVKCGAREDLGRPKEKPSENKESFMSFLEENIAFTEKNAISDLKKIAKNLQAKNVLIFTGKNSYKDIQKTVEKQLKIKGLKIHRYNDFSTNPKAEEIDRALEMFGVSTFTPAFNLIIAAGGGSVMDFAKLFRLCYDNNVSSKEALNLAQNAVKKTPLAAIPTTAGTGAEATKFTVVYVDGKKHSFEHKFILPDYAIVHSDFVRNNPKYLKASCGADAMCQAIESYWSVNSTKESKSYAKTALELCRDYLVKYVNTNDSKAAQQMALASYLSGKAINISKTTAAHALSYKITTDYAIPHGHAVSLSISKLMMTNEKAQNVSDPRGKDYVIQTMCEIKEILRIKDIEEYFFDLFEKISLEQDLKKLGINSIEEIVNSVNAERLKNNPVKLTKEDLNSLF